MPYTARNVRLESERALVSAALVEERITDYREHGCHVTIIETVQRVTPLGVAFHDLLTDTRITDGLVVSARPTQQVGRFRAGAPTASGVHVITGIPGLRDAEFPRPAPGERGDFDDLPSSVGMQLDVLVEDRLRRFLPAVVQLDAPRRGVALAADALSGCSSLVWSVPTDTPMFLMSGPERSIPSTSAVVRACLRHHGTGEPAAHAVLVVETAESRAVGVADGLGNVVVTFAYPSFESATTPGSTPAGSHGIPTTEQQWPVTIDVRWDPQTLRFPTGVDIPRIHTVFCQRAGTVHADDAGPATATMPATLEYGVPLILETANPADPDRGSYLFVEPAP